MTPTLEERTLDLLAEFKRDYDIDADDDGSSTLRDRITEHLSAVEQAATKVAYERAAIEAAGKEYGPMSEDRWQRGYNCGRRSAADEIRALADGDSDG